MNPQDIHRQRLIGKVHATIPDPQEAEALIDTLQQMWEAQDRLTRLLASPHKGGDTVLAYRVADDRLASENTHHP